VNHEVFDVLVAGGGPGGSALSFRLARAGCSVALLERTAYGEFRVGESLPPRAVESLARLGVWKAFLQTEPGVVYGVQSAWGSAELDSSSFLNHPFLNGWHVDRSRFDCMLNSAATEAGAHVFRETSARTVERDRQGIWLVEAHSPRGQHHFRARFLVDATGRSGQLCARLGIRRHRIDRMVGIAALCPEPVEQDILPSLIEAHPLGWWYSAGFPSGGAIAIFFTDSDLCARRGLAGRDGWSRILNQTQHTRQRLSGCSFSAKPGVFPAGTHRLDRSAGDGWLAIGDAAVGRDPLSSSGIDFALASAERAYQVVQALASGASEPADLYNTELRHDFAVYLSQRHAYYMMEDRWPNSPFWLRRRFGISRATLSLGP